MNSEKLSMQFVRTIYGNTCERYVPPLSSTLSNIVELLWNLFDFCMDTQHWITILWYCSMDRSLCELCMQRHSKEVYAVNNKNSDYQTTPRKWMKKKNPFHLSLYFMIFFLHILREIGLILSGWGHKRRIGLYEHQYPILIKGSVSRIWTYFQFKAERHFVQIFNC